jgi:hypothetical protein
MLAQKLMGATAAATALSYTFNTEVNDSVDRSSYTFSNVGIGGASSSRIVYAAVIVGFGSSSGAVDSVTIGGVTASLVVREGDANSSGSNLVHCGIWKAEIPTGATASIVVSNNQTATRATVATYSVYGSSNTTVNTQTANSSNTSAMTMDVTGAVAPSIIIAAATSTTTPGSYTWSGVTEDFDSTLEIRINSSASSLIQTSGTVSVTATINTSAARYTAVAARIR